MQLETLTCACGSADIFAIEPGYDPVREGPTNVLLDAGAPSVGRCLACMVRRFPGMNKVEAVQ